MHQNTKSLDVPCEIEPPKTIFWAQGSCLTMLLHHALFGIGRSLQLEGSRHAGIVSQVKYFLDNHIKQSAENGLTSATTTSRTQSIFCCQSRAGQTGTRRAADHDNRTVFFLVFTSFGLHVKDTFVTVMCHVCFIFFCMEF